MHAKRMREELSTRKSRRDLHCRRALNKGGLNRRFDRLYERSATSFDPLPSATLASPIFFARAQGCHAQYLPWFLAQKPAMYRVVQFSYQHCFRELSIHWWSAADLPYIQLMWVKFGGGFCICSITTSCKSPFAIEHSIQFHNPFGSYTLRENTVRCHCVNLDWS